jgi:hypothetical protein
MQGLGGATHPSKLLASASGLFAHRFKFTTVKPDPAGEKRRHGEGDDVDGELDQTIRAVGPDAVFEVVADFHALRQEPAEATWRPRGR